MLTFSYSLEHSRLRYIFWLGDLTLDSTLHFVGSFFLEKIIFFERITTQKNMCALSQLFSYRESVIQLFSYSVIQLFSYSVIQWQCLEWQHAFEQPRIRGFDTAYTAYDSVNSDKAVSYDTRRRYHLYPTAMGTVVG